MSSTPGLRSATGLLLCFVLLCSSSWVKAQPFTEIRGVGGAGWWIAQNGQPGQEDKSLVEFQAGAGLTLGYTIDARWEIGLMAEWDRILGYYLRAAGDRVGARDRIRIAEGEAFSIVRYGIRWGAWPVSTQHFRMGPQLSFGLFEESSIHPDKAAFSSRLWWSASIPMQWRIGKKMRLEAGPTYYLHSIRESLPDQSRHRHTIEKIGGLLGFVFE